MVVRPHKSSSEVKFSSYYRPSSTMYELFHLLTRNFTSFCWGEGEFYFARARQRRYKLLNNLDRSKVFYNFIAVVTHDRLLFIFFLTAVRRRNRKYSSKERKEVMRNLFNLLINLHLSFILEKSSSVKNVENRHLVYITCNIKNSFIQLNNYRQSKS